ncbi:hypothetical protein Pcinc_011451 [Petrolisthes cinctipes]|uniref:MADF domain-containing protein n=1 Tax=Petrolisthes cinctipes TaxID=88211 RepID=A0AAE1KSI8_PETCI|nr:hypothetical protein Pcinc_011451 [Petrolisthes cinctipes]
MKKDQNTYGKLLKKGKKWFAAPLSAEVTTDPATDPASDPATDPTSGPSDPVTSKQSLPEDPVSQRTKPLCLAPEVERELGEWLHSNQFLYDRGCISYKDTQRKTRILQEKATSLDPPLTAAELRRWIHSMRTRYGRLTKAMSGSGASKPPMERDKWILHIFDFMGKHIVRHKATKTLGIKEVTHIIVVLF